MNKLAKTGSSVVFPGVLSFGITYIRITLAFATLFLWKMDAAVLWISWIVCMIMVFDHYDGKLFRISALNASPFWRKQRRILDSCGDRICIQFVCIPLLFANPKFLVPYAIICLKEILTSYVCICEFRNGYIIYPPRIAKLSSICVGLTAIFALFQNAILMSISATLLFILGFISFRAYRKKIALLSDGCLIEGEDYEYISFLDK